MQKAVRTESESREPDSSTLHHDPPKQADMDHPVLRLQRTIGNQAAQRVLRSSLKSGPGRATTAPQLKRELPISSPGDPEEVEAEQVAGKVMRMTEPALANPQRESGPGSAGIAEGGAPLPDEVRSYFQPRFGRDFGDVRVHAAGDAAKSAESLDARAYTVGNDIVFGSGTYEPSTGEGKRLLAHELAHVAQQSGEELSIQREAATTRTPAAPTERLTGTLWARDATGKNLLPSLDDIAQGAVGDCFLFAAMSAIVSTHPEAIMHMIRENADGSYTVTFKGIGFWSSAHQTVTSDFVKGRHGNVTGRGALWPLVIESAYAKEKGGLDVIDKGGNAGSAIDDMLNDGPSRFDPREKTADYILGKLAKAKAKKWPMVVLGPKSGDGSKKTMATTVQLHFNHSYAIIDVDALHNRIKLFNPWGSDHPNGDGWVDVEVVRKFFIEVDISD